MSKHRKNSLEMDDEFFAQLDFLRSDYDHALETIEHQKRDLRKLISLLIEYDIPLPGDIIDRYISRVSESNKGEPEELPFD